MADRYADHAGLDVLSRARRAEHRDVGKQLGEGTAALGRVTTELRLAEDGAVEREQFRHEHARQLARIGSVESELDFRVACRVEQRAIAPPASYVQVLGPVPAGGEALVAWKRGALILESRHLGCNIDASLPEQSSALGTRDEAATLRARLEMSRIGPPNSTAAPWNVMSAWALVSDPVVRRRPPSDSVGHRGRVAPGESRRPCLRGHARHGECPGQQAPSWPNLLLTCASPDSSGDPSSLPSGEGPARSSRAGTADRQGSANTGGSRWSGCPPWRRHLSVTEASLFWDALASRFRDRVDRSHEAPVFGSPSQPVLAASGCRRVGRAERPRYRGNRDVERTDRAEARRGPRATRRGALAPRSPVAAS